MAQTVISCPIELIADIQDYSRTIGKPATEGTATLAALGDRFYEEVGRNGEALQEYVRQHKDWKKDMPDEIMLMLNVDEVYRGVINRDSYMPEQWSRSKPRNVRMADEDLANFRRKAKSRGMMLHAFLVSRIYFGLLFVTRTSQYSDELDKLDALIETRQASAEEAEQAEAISKAVGWAFTRIYDPVFDMFKKRQHARIKAKEKVIRARVKGFKIKNPTAEVSSSAAGLMNKTVQPKEPTKEPKEVLS